MPLEGASSKGTLIVKVNNLTHPDILFGRLGNRMFQMAALYAKAREENTDWYFQDPKFFKNYEKEIINLFSEGIDPVPFVSIHVRRGDYIGNKFYNDLSQSNYYDKAIEMFPDDKFLVFSDDPKFCKDLFLKRKDKERFKVIEGQNEIDDMNLMASCKHNIIANSSYSFWCAYLNPNPNKKIIAPSYERYYADKSESRTVLPDEWIKI